MASKHVAAGLMSALLATSAIAQPLPAPTLPLAGTEVTPCLQGPGYKGCTVGEIGSYAQTLPLISSINIPASVGAYPANWFSDSGGKVQRINDRLFYGACTANTGAFGNNGDWLSQLNGAALGAAQVAGFCAETTNALDAIVAGSESLNAQASGSPVAGGAFYGVLNNASFANAGWGVYGECRFYTTAATTSCIGEEFDPVNLTGTDSTDPDPFNPYPTHYAFGEQLACGGGFTGTVGPPNFGVTANQCTTAMNVAPNGSVFRAGIVFQNGSLSGGNAIELPHNYGIVWFSSAHNGVNFINSVATTNVVGSVISMADGQTNFESLAGAFSVEIATPASSVNVLELSGNTTGNPVAITADGTGSDTNIGIQLNPKGNGGVIVNPNNFLRVGSVTVGNLATADPSPQAGDMISVSDTTGCTANSTVTGGGSTTCALVYSGAAWKAIVTH